MNNQQETEKKFLLPGVVFILKEAWEVYKERLDVLVAIAAAPLIVTNIFLALLRKSSLLYDKPLFIVSLLLVFFAVAFSWTQVAIIIAIKDRKEEPGFVKSYKKATPKVASYLWVIILTNFLILGGSLFFVIPGIIFYAWFGLAPIVLVVENRRGMNALLKSRDYIKGMFVPFLWRFLFIGLVNVLIFWAFYFVLAMFNIPLREEIGSSLTGLLIGPLVTIYIYFLYTHFRKLKGDFVFNSSIKRKALFLLLPLLGISGIVLLIFLASLIF